MHKTIIIIILHFLLNLLIDFREWGREKERENADVRQKRQPVAFVSAPTGDQTHNLGMCPDWETKPATFWFIELRSNQLSHVARAICIFPSALSLAFLLPLPK